MPETPVADDDGAQAAAGIVERYFALIETGRFAQAYDLWEPQAAGDTRSQFRASFAQYAEYHATVGTPGRVDAGAGQRYVTVPVRTYGKLSAGGAFARNGSAILHRTADIDGATAAQRSWRIRSIELQPATPSAR
ncbi:hypothetical protein M9980_07980 [Sphingomonas donggukensis]|uniref:SnoaL-like domain-containing protein n=1 Tax=Sphingomonas donggukensis TaxID=2949093 RepID=A0ABY4TZ42_9SPHN|nr:hypothetical protein [Sphingomonas donggukensis]URW77155.1 hypothetical protein M9980_07980 [Sphingomonas donggukensis]